MRERRRRGWRWTIALGATIVLVVAAATVPDLLLDRELALARSEGLLTTAREVANSSPSAEGANAAPAVREIIAAERIDFPVRQRIRAAAEELVLGFPPSSPARRRDEAQAYLRSHPDWTLRWRRVAALPRLDFGRDWSQPLVTRPELGYVKTGVDRLLAAALSGIEPRRNVDAAARLTAMIAQEPGLSPLMVHISTGKRVLEVASRLGFAGKANRALGPVPTLRFALRAEPVASLALQRDLRKREGWDLLRYGSRLPWQQRLSGLRPFALNGERGTIRLYRDLFRALRYSPSLEAEFAVFLAYGVPFSQHFQIYAKGLGPHFSLSSMSTIFQSQIRDYLWARQKAGKATP